MTNNRIPAEIAETIVDPKAFADITRIDEAFSYLRREIPLGIAQPNGFDPFWVVSKFDDIKEVEQKGSIFICDERSVTLTNVEADKYVRELMGGSPHLVRSLVQMDNPDHHKYRILTQAWFMPQNLKKLDARFREIARTFVDRMEEYGGECDFARDIALFYPLHVIMEILGVPEADEPKMLKLTQELFSPSDPEFSRNASGKESVEAQLALMMETVEEFNTYFTAMTDDRRKNPRDDLASLIANGKIDDAPLGYLEAMSYYIIAATAGHDTTSNTIAGGLWALCEDPASLQKLKADASLIPAFIEESIRWVTPVKHFMRTATQDYELRGQIIKKGDWLYLAYSSGNRDEDIFNEPFRFDMERTPNKHVSMGFGRHVCLGQHLARMEMRIFWEELFSRLESVELAGTPLVTAANFVSGPKSVPIKFQMRP